MIHDGSTVRPLSAMLAENSARHGRKPAFADDRREVSWAELARRTSGLAAGLHVDRGTRVAFCLDNSVELVEGLLATVRAAAVGVPLSPRGTDAELAVLLADCDPAVLVTDRRNLPRFTGSVNGVRLVVTGSGPVPDGVVRFDDLVAEVPARDDLGLDDPAWFFYTSGTSGVPKAAVFSQRSALWSAVACYQPLLEMSAADRVLWPLPLTHTYAHSLCVLGTIVAGATARITADPSSLVRLIGEFAPTVLGGVPLTYQQLLDTGLGAVPSLRLCVTAGAPCDPELREQVELRFGAPLLDGYGSTETSGKIAMETLAGPRVRGSSGPVVPGMAVRIVDPATGQDTRGEGEIWVRGPGLMLGYHNQPDVLRDGWYPTGDLGKVVEHGHLSVTGRHSDRIVRGGENVDPAEVEQVLRGLPGVLDAAVVARAHALLGEVPVAFVVPANEDLDITGLLRACAAVLSAHKVPDEVLFTPAIPRTGAGKPQRAVLRATLIDQGPSPEFAQLAARPSAERRTALADLVRAEASDIGCDVTDPGIAFADLGLTSMSAMSLCQRLSRRTGLRLPATLIWDHPTPAAVAAYLDTRLRGGAAVSATPRRGPGAEPIAIVAAACRYPGGVRSPEDLWRLVADGVDATGDFPADRGWDLDAIYHPDPDHVGTTYTRRGGFLDDVADFDPLFFGISPKEALATDPQHRLLLEVAWEALERAGIPAQTLRATRTGVYVGLMHAAYGTGAAPQQLESHIAIGSSGSVASGRISYVFGFTGPTMTVDTACSSSLVSINLAASALRAGECTLALAGGATVLSSPQPFIAFSRQRALSRDGRCRSFGAGADGTGWSEGVGLVLLEKLEDARRNGHPVLAVLRGSSVNSDGASNGLTAPSGEAQRELIRLALTDAGLSAADVDVVEGHGTGTVLGDPIEVGAVLDTYGQNRAGAEPLWLGSVKSNLGHTQAAAGVAGVIKMIEAMRHGELPRSLYSEQPSPHVDWSAGAVRVLDRARPWAARDDRPRRAAISSFGIGGTNAHVIIEEPPAEEVTGDVPVRPLPVLPWLVSGSDEAGLRANAARLAAGLADESTLDIAYSLATTRAPLAHRAAVLSGGPAVLRDLASGNGNPALLTGTARSNLGVALLCAGQGAQRAGMGRELAAVFPKFGTAFQQACEAFTPWLDRPLLSVIDEQDLLDRTEYAQPALFAFAVAMHALLDEFGVRPDHLAGHSIGELAAAHLAGVFSFQDAVRLVAARGRLMGALPTGGVMVAVRASLDAVANELDDRVAIAAVNGPNSVVLSGDEDAVAAVTARLGCPNTRLRVSHAFHSPMVEPMLAAFREVAESITYHQPAVPLVSTVDEGPEAMATADYWVRQARDTVRFADAVATLTAAGVTAFVQAGPSVGVLAEESAPLDAMCVSCSDADTLLTTLAELHVHGMQVDWEAVYSATGARKRALPTYPFQRQRYWLEAARHRVHAGHPLIGAPQPDADGPGIRYVGVLSTTTHAWLADHMIGDQVLVPATVFAELAFRAAGTSGAVRLEELAFHEPLVLSAPAQVQVVTVERSITVWARTDNGPWTRHATATTAPAGAAQVTASSWPPRDSVPIQVDYARLAAHGHHYGPAFRAVTALWRRGTDLFADLTLPEQETTRADAYTLHPALMDAALHAALLADGPAEPRVPVACTGVTVYATGATVARAHLARIGPDEVRVTLTDHSGRRLAAVDSLVTRPLQVAARMYRVAWRPATPGTENLPHELFDLAGVDTPDDLPGRALALVTATLARVRDWVAGSQPGRLVVLTRNATGDDPDPAEAAVAGFVRSAQSEHPGRVALVDGQISPDALRTDEPEMAVRDGVVLVPRLTVADAPDSTFTLDTEGTVLITGGTGALGASLARYLVAQHGIRHLLLASRSGRTPDWAAGLPVTVVKCDVRDREAVEAVVASARPNLTAVFHLAGVVADGVVDRMTPHRVADVLGPKADGAWNLHQATRDLELSAFVLYSSAAGVLGRPGQSNYAAANGFLDALARHRVAGGLPAQALAWGPWSTVDEGGMADGKVRRHLGDVPAVTEQEGIALLDAALRTKEPVLVPIPLGKAARAVDAPRILADLSPSRRRAESSAAESSTAEPAVQAPGAWRNLLTAVPADEREAVLTDLVRAELAAVLGFPHADAFPADRSFGELGFDSLTGLQLRNRLSAFTGVRLAATVALDHPTLPALVEHVNSALNDVLPVPEDAEPSFGVSVVYHRVLREQGPFEAMALRFFGSYAVPSFAMADRARYAVEPVRLANGDATPVVYIPDYLTPYNRVPTGLAKQFDGDRDLYLLEQPGFGSVRAVPGSMDTLVRTHADTVRALSADRPVVLAGFCAGGVIAHAVALHLAETGRPPAGVVLLDTHIGVLQRDDPRALALLAASTGLPDGIVAGFDDSLLLAGGGYARVLDGWSPEPSPVPTLLVRGRATSEMRETDPDRDWRPSWPLPHDTADVTGDHHSLVHQDAGSTAGAIRSWLATGDIA